MEDFDALLTDLFQQATEFVQMLILKEHQTNWRETKIVMKLWPEFLTYAVTRH